MAYIPVDIEKSVLKECKRRRYSDRTAKTYLFCIDKFLKWCKKDIGQISKKDVRLFLEHLSDKEKAGSTMNVYHMALRFLFTQVLNKKMWIDIKYSKVPEKLPDSLSKDEIKLLLNSIKNRKHRFMIAFLYGSGMRVSEFLNLRVRDVDTERKYGFVRNGKGGKDRIFILPEKLASGVKGLIIADGLKVDYLIWRNNRGRKYSARTIQMILKRARKIAGISKRVTPHTLRHSFATHLIENGNSVSEVQSLLGHKSPETTFIYLHTASPSLIKVKSPLDNL